MRHRDAQSRRENLEEHKALPAPPEFQRVGRAKYSILRKSSRNILKELRSGTILPDLRVRLVHVVCHRQQKILVVPFCAPQEKLPEAVILLYYAERSFGLVRAVSPPHVAFFIGNARKTNGKAPFNALIALAIKSSPLQSLLFVEL